MYYYILILTFALLSPSTKVSAESRADQSIHVPAKDDQLIGSPAISRVQQVPLPDTGLGKSIRNHFVVIATPAPTLDEARARERASLKRLLVDPTTSARILENYYQKIGEHRYFERWSTIKVLADLKTPSAHKLLSEIASSKLPPERAKDLHHRSTKESEIMIRLRAVDGLGALGRNGNIDASNDLYRIITTDQTNVAVKRRAIRAYLAIDGDSAKRAIRLKKELPDAFHGSITLHVTSENEFIRRIKQMEKSRGKYVRSKSSVRTTSGSDSNDKPPKVRRTE